MRLHRGVIDNAPGFPEALGIGDWEVPACTQSVLGRWLRWEPQAGSVEVIIGAQYEPRAK